MLDNTVAISKKLAALYSGARAVVLALAFIGAAFAWGYTRASTADVDLVRQEQAENFRKLDRWALRHFGDSFLDERQPPRQEPIPTDIARPQ